MYVYRCLYTCKAKQPFMKSCSLNNHSLCKGRCLKGMAVWGTTVYKWLSGYPCMYVYIHIYIYVYKFTHTHTRIQTHTHTHSHSVLYFWYGYLGCRLKQLPGCSSHRADRTALRARCSGFCTRGCSNPWGSNRPKVSPVYCALGSPLGMIYVLGALGLSNSRLHTRFLYISKL